jgi:hypothetical protein
LPPVLLGNDSTYTPAIPPTFVFDGLTDFAMGVVSGWEGAGTTAGSSGGASFSGVFGYIDSGDLFGTVGVNSGANYNTWTLPGAGVFMGYNGMNGLQANSDTGTAVFARSGGTAVDASSSSTATRVSAIYGAISSTSPGPSSAAVRGENRGTGGNGIGVCGSHDGSGWGMYAQSKSGLGLMASGDTTGVSAGGGTTGVLANGGTIGVEGMVTGASGPPSGTSCGVYGSGSNGSNLGKIGVEGVSDTNTGVSGTSTSGTGVSGKSSGVGVSGTSSGGLGIGVLGQNSVGIGVLGQGGVGVPSGPRPHPRPSPHNRNPV